MPLLPVHTAAMTTAITTAMAAGLISPFASRDQIAEAIADAYATFALNAVSCALQPPTLVDLAGLKDGLKAAFVDNESAPEAAADWRVALDTYWEGALFGVTGSVIDITGGGLLEAALAAVFANQANTLQSAAQGISTALDAYTRTVTVRDTVLPTPPGAGCGPAPIT